MNAINERQSLEEEHGWPSNEHDDPPRVTEGDVTEDALAAELAAADEAAEAQRDDQRCAPTCTHHGRCPGWFS